MVSSLVRSPACLALLVPLLLSACGQAGLTPGAQAAADRPEFAAQVPLPAGTAGGSLSAAYGGRVLREAPDADEGDALLGFSEGQVGGGLTTQGLPSVQVERNRDVFQAGEAAPVTETARRTVWVNGSFTSWASARRTVWVNGRFGPVPASEWRDFRDDACDPDEEGTPGAGGYGHGLNSAYKTGWARAASICPPS
ncbi:hypothetical protein E5F05_03710 (plasmid) [Deinococcus metallilatus]|uniref:Lipoprotein n=1 Tax=Deinococcus metallilatus TaxID=1211322 RepID=A0AAJ5F5J8_9DEIO|nr:hypothetical protein [Deinococcus metallilatus]MBB5293245.1 hypothetical protein [Deinococcus metallilatus]QBY07032.1 hypothetical protein E5F05_03710 [Deinococcus metallilatus]RXJ18043.1 hypothetical protein ERJ73_01360 [Deinococcus metallilatus]TLK31979.1 hypothetical protein FCS05_00475 [Deinococcus metallilatus]GMA15531.1 hypothetical protein GCM10025871_18620 [Deinococcus metallilatus]